MKKIMRLLLATLLSSLLLPIGPSLAQTEETQANEAVEESNGSISEAEMIRRMNDAVDMANRAVAEGRAPMAPNIDKLPQPVKSAAAAPSNVDIEALARRLDTEVTHGQAPQMNNAPALFAFVSFSMPKASLDRLVADAETYGAVLVLRGLVDHDLKKTARAAQALIGSRKVGWIIDPQAFKRFAVDSVPSYVLVRAQALPHACALHQCYDDGDFAKLSGDVTTRYALDKIAAVAPGFERDAGFYTDKGARP